MELFLPIAHMDVNIVLILLYGALVGFLSGLVGVGGGFLITPLLIFTGIPPIVAVSSGAAQMADDWRKAFFRLKEKQGYYHEDDRAIRVFGNRLFIADMRLPGDLQVGTYTIETLLVKSGKVVGHTVGDFKVRLSGIERRVWNAAHDYPWLFGSLFTLAAMVLGFALNAIPYRKR